MEWVTSLSRWSIDTWAKAHGWPTTPPSPLRTRVASLHPSPKNSLHPSPPPPSPPHSSLHHLAAELSYALDTPPHSSPHRTTSCVLPSTFPTTYLHHVEDPPEYDRFQVTRFQNADEIFIPTLSKEILEDYKRGKEECADLKVEGASLWEKCCLCGIRPSSNNFYRVEQVRMHGFGSRFDV